MTSRNPALKLSSTDDLESLGEETPLLRLRQSLIKHKQLDPRHSVLASLATFVAGLLFLIAMAAMIMRYRVSTSAALDQSVEIPSELVLLSAHLGPKFFGLESVLALNKARFAEINKLPLYLAEEFFGKQRSESSPALLTDFMRIKFQLALEVFSQRGEDTKWAVWVDGDAWLNEAPVNLSKQLHLKENDGMDMIVGTELPGLNATSDLPSCTGINTAVFAIRNSPASIAVLKRLLTLGPAEAEYNKDHFDDQCAIETLWKMDPTTRQRALVLGSADTGRQLQCRTQRKCKRFFPDLCCSAESWNIQWPASDWHDIAERIIEEEAGTDIVTRTAHALEVDACSVASWIAGKAISACSQIMSW